MIGVLGALTVRRDASVVVYECRRCGTTLEGATADCPYGCGGNVVRFEI